MAPQLWNNTDTQNCMCTVSPSLGPSRLELMTVSMLQYGENLQKCVIIKRLEHLHIP